MKHKIRELLAYIEPGNGEVLIDLVKLTRNGHSYYFQGKRWLRNLRCMGGDGCTSDQGETINIAILNRRYSPAWVAGKTIRVTDRAKERYQVWLEGMNRCE